MPQDASEKEAGQENYIDLTGPKKQEPPKEHKKQAKTTSPRNMLPIAVIILLVISFAAGLFTGRTLSVVEIVKYPSCPVYRCEEIAEPVLYEAGAFETSGVKKRDIFFRTQDPVIEVPIKNTGGNPAYFWVDLTCFSLHQPPANFSSDRMYLKPSESRKFDVALNITTEDKEWKCLQDPYIHTMSSRECRLSII